MLGSDDCAAAGFRSRIGDRRNWLFCVALGRLTLPMVVPGYHTPNQQVLVGGGDEIRIRGIFRVQHRGMPVHDQPLYGQKQSFDL